MARITYNFRGVIGLFIILVVIGGSYYALTRQGITLRDLFDRGTSTITINGLPFAVEVADTPADREQGLSGRKAISGAVGLLLVFPESEYHRIWMRDMQFPIDIIWITADYRIAGITSDATPESYPDTFRPPEPVRYVLETKPGFAEVYGIQVSDMVTLPERYR